MRSNYNDITVPVLGVKVSIIINKTEKMLSLADWSVDYEDLEKKKKILLVSVSVDHCYISFNSYGYAFFTYQLAD